MGTTPQVLVGRYEVGRLLGAGGMAEVYEGHDRLLARRVAIKVLLAQYAHDPSFLTRFRREAQAAASLSHPNIVAVFDTGAEDDIWFIVMEYVAGRTLKDVIRTEGALYWARAAEIAADVAGALTAAHARGVVHRDVKPGNVMLTTDGKVKVMDFGIARASAVPSITQTAAVVGTAQYIAPEQAQGLEVDARTDVYALGCCLYEMLTGQVPFTGPTPVAIAYRHVREDPTPPRMLNPDVPVSLEQVCLKAMAKQPQDRYQTAMEMRQDLERVRAGQPVSVGVPLSSQATQAIGAGGVAENPTTVLGGTQTMGGGRSIGYEQELPGQRRSSAGWVVAAILALVVVGFAAFLITRALTSPSQSGTTTLTTQTPPTTAPATTTTEATTTTQATTTTERPTSTTRRSTTTSTERTTTSSSTTRPTTTTSGALSSVTSVTVPTSTAPP